MPRLSVAAALAGCLLLLATVSAHAQRTATPKQTDPQVVLEVRLMTVSEALFERLGLDFETIKWNEACVKTVQEAAETPPLKRTHAVTAQNLGLAFLSDLQLFQLLEAAQGDRRTNVLQAPRLTVQSGESANVDLTDTQLFVTGIDMAPDGRRVLPKTEAFRIGFRMTAKPVVSADRRFVRLALGMSHTELAPGNVPLVPVQIPVPCGNDKDANALPEKVFQMFLQQPQLRAVAFDNTVAIPDGATAVFGGLKKLTEARTEFGPPVVSKIPYVNRLFRNVGYSVQTESLLILVTPRILADEPEKGPVTPAIFLDQDTVERAAAVKPANAKAAPARQARVLAELLRAYENACAAGRIDEAERLARAALCLDPTCFRGR